MTLPTVEGTRQRGGVYHSNVRVPVELADKYAPKTLIQRSLKTSDPKVAALEVARIRVQLADEVKAARVEEGHRLALDQLTPDQRALYTRAGGLPGLLKDYERTKTALAFLQAGDPSRGAMPFDVDEDAAGAPVKVDTGGPEVDPVESSMVMAEQRATVGVLTDAARDSAKLLSALGQPQADVPGGNVTTLSDLVEAYIDAKGVATKTADAIRYVARRFKELHGDRPLSELVVDQLRDYAAKVLTLPVSTAADIRPLSFYEAVARAKREGLPTVSPQTRKKHVSFLKALTAFGRDQGYLSPDPWAGFRIVERQQKYSASAKVVRRPFTGEEIGKLLAASAALHAATIDRWAPILAAYQGARREEIGQLRRCDVQQIEGVWCIALTDEGEDQKIKNRASLRTVPLHPAVIGAGFLDHVQNINDPTSFIFKEQERWGGALRDLVPDSDGRLTERYGKRFARLKAKAIGQDLTAVFHSFRHSWEDAAEAATIPQTHRRDLAGRTRAGDSQAAYGAGPTMRALAESLAKVDPLAT